MGLIKKHRKRRGWTQGELSRLTSLSESLIAQVEVNMKPVSRKTTIKLARALDCNPVSIYLEGTDFKAAAGEVEARSLAMALDAVLSANQN